MNPTQRELLIYRLLSNQRICELDNISYIIRNPTPQIVYEANLFYRKIIDKYKYINLLTRERAVELLISMELLIPTYESIIKELEQRLENYKIEIYRNSFRPSSVEQYRTLIKNTHKNINKITQEKYAIDQYTLEYFADTSKYMYIIYHTLYSEDGQKIYEGKMDNIDDKLLNALADILRDGIISHTMSRELARSEPWTTLWRVGKPNPFSCHPSLLNDEQKNLIMYSFLYDSIWENPDHPVEDVINDDDMLDGWLALQRLERKKAQSERQMESMLGDKIGNASEIFLPANSLDDINRIRNLNSPNVLHNQKIRSALLQQVGEVRDQDMPDVKLELQMQANRGGKPA